MDLDSCGILMTRLYLTSFDSYEETEPSQGKKSAVFHRILSPRGSGEPCVLRVNLRSGRPADRPSPNLEGGAVSPDEYDRIIFQGRNYVAMRLRF